MKEYLIKRAFVSLLLFFVTVITNFFIFRLMPGDPTLAVVGMTMTTEMRLKIIERFGLDRSLWEQFVAYIRNTFTGEFGVSFVYNKPVVEVIFERRFMNTVMLMGPALFLASIVGSVIAIVAAWKRGSKFDLFVVLSTLILYSVPVFFSGLIILLVFSYHLGWIPMGGVETYGAQLNLYQYVFDYLHHMIAPMFVLVAFMLASYFLVMRNTILDIFMEAYITTAEAKGLSDRDILFKHAGRNALLPTVSLIAVQTSSLISGAILTETVFSWNGIGRLIYDSVLYADYPVLQTVFLIMSLIVILSNFFVDVLYVYLDPRIRAGYSAH